MITASIAPERRRWAVAVGAALASGALLWAASPAGGLGWAAWVALTPAALVAFRYPDTRAGRLALPLAFGISLELLLIPALPFGLAEDQWADEFVVPIMVGDSPVLVVALVLVPLAVALLYALRFPFLGPPALLAGALGWTALDLLRTKFDPGGLWGPLFLTQHETSAAPIAALGGPWLLSFAIALGGLGLARGPRAAVPAVALALALGIGGAVATERPPRGTTVVGAVQPGYDTAQYELPLLRNHQLKRYEPAARDLIRDLTPLTLSAARQGAELIVWPEAVVWVDPRETESVRSALAALAREAGATLVVPYFLRGPAHGAAVVFPPGGAPSRPAPKQRPMWFVGERGDNRRGPVRPLGGHGTLLGVDNQDPAVARALARRGADTIASSTHDWAQLAVHQRAAARLWSRALGVPLVRADWRYGSAVVDRGDDDGATRAAARFRSHDAAVAPPRWTPYRTLGDALGWAAVAAAALVALLRWRASGG